MPKTNGNGDGRVIPLSQGIIKGSVDSIPSDLGRARNQYNWDEFEVGDHKEFTIEEAPSARSSATSFARGTKDRPARNFASRTVEKTAPNGKKVKVVEIWRLPDPVVGSAANSNEDENTDQSASAAE